MRISKGVVPHPRKILLYGVQGVGKTRLAASFPRPFVLDLERGSLDFDCERNQDPIVEYGGVQEWFSWFLTTDHGYNTLVIDSLTRLQELVATHLCRKANKDTVGEIGGGFGRGKEQVETVFSMIKGSVEAFIARGMAVVMIAHATEIKHNPPDQPSYTKYEPDLLEEVRDMFVRYCDEVFFLRQESFVVKEKEGFGSERGQNRVTQRRQLVTQDTGGICAKHRLGLAGMPDVIDADFQTYFRYVMAMAQYAPLQSAASTEKSASDISGIVNNGSSKPVEPSNPVAAELAASGLF